MRPSNSKSLGVEGPGGDAGSAPAAAGRWLAAAWAALLTASMALHAVGLGDRTLSHDESIHAHQSWQLAAEGYYRHDPTFHGPFLYHVNAVVFSLFGDSDVTARAAPAVAGVLLVVAMLPMRRFLGEAGALCAGTLAAISPSLLFYGRHLRNDIYMALFATIWVFAMLSYLEERRVRWLWCVTIAAALSFATKETAFLTGLSLGSFLWCGRWRESGAARRPGARAPPWSWRRCSSFWSSPSRRRSLTSPWAGTRSNTTVPEPHGEASVSPPRSPLRVWPWARRCGAERRVSEVTRGARASIPRDGRRSSPASGGSPSCSSLRVCARHPAARSAASSAASATGCRSTRCSAGRNRATTT
ncbi:MAG: TIGR03663 family protein [Thermoanaerobaculia bacterium]|nr:TIGR03663 family protein [Thermoanaerobaculia bacterium]